MSDYLRDLFQIGQATHRPAFVRKDVLDWIADQGRVAVVRLTPDFCPHTDATLPTPSRRIETTADDVDHAYSLLAELYHEEEMCGGDDWFEIWDRNGKIVPAVPEPAPIDELAGFPF